MLLVTHAFIGMPMASLDCWKRFLDAHSISVKREFSAANLALAGFPLTNSLGENLPSRH